MTPIDLVRKLRPSPFALAGAVALLMVVSITAPPDYFWIKPLAAPFLVVLLARAQKLHPTPVMLLISTALLVAAFVAAHFGYVWLALLVGPFFLVSLVRMGSPITEGLIVTAIFGLLVNFTLPPIDNSAHIYWQRRRNELRLERERQQPRPVEVGR